MQQIHQFQQHMFLTALPCVSSRLKTFDIVLLVICAEQMEEAPSVNL